ncbi:MAG: DUF1648 domain-containing protein [Bacteroidales bacterium]|jgi:uncharacterized membrane protein|nr:DUF1648 domain-containing protein [Bacteroidales bacterium]
MKKRPKIKLALTTPDKMFEAAGWISVWLIWVLILIHYSGLPDTIPIHYNAAGQPDGFGGKVNILILPVISTVLFIGLTILNRYPHIFNFPVNITENNALQQYTNATRIIRYLKLILVLIFGFITFRTIQYANGQADGLGTGFLPLMLGFIFIPLVYFIVQSFLKK